jgi:hypothetical protein
MSPILRVVPRTLRRALALAACLAVPLALSL